MNIGNLVRIERLNYLLGGILVIAAAVTQPQRIALGVVCGVVLTCLNFLFLRKLIGKWTTDAAEGRSTAGGSVLMLPKMIGLMLAVVLCLAYLPIDAIAFAVGYSVFVASIFIEVILSVVLPTPAEPPTQPPSETNDHG